MSQGPPPPPAIKPGAQAYQNARLVRELRQAEGWNWFIEHHQKELERLRDDVMLNLAPGEKRDAAIAKYRTIKETVEFPERAFEGAMTVIANLPRKDDLEAADIPLT